jgi:hypothetical protein
MENTVTEMEVITPLTPDQEKSLAIEIVGESFPLETQLEIVYFFGRDYQKLQGMSEEALAIQITDEEDVEGMKKADDTRKVFKKLKVELNKRFKITKDKAWNFCKAVDSAKNKVAGLAEKIEKHCEIQAKFAETKAHERFLARKAERMQLIVDAGGDPSQQTGFASLPDAGFNALLFGIKEQIRQEKEEAERAEQERIKEEAEERERVRQLEEANKLRALVDRRKTEILRAGGTVEDIDSFGDDIKDFSDDAWAQKVETIRIRVEAKKKADKEARDQEIKELEDSRRAQNQELINKREREEAINKAESNIIPFTPIPPAPPRPAPTQSGSQVPPIAEPIEKHFVVSVQYQRQTTSISKYLVRASSIEEANIEPEEGVLLDVKSIRNDVTDREVQSWLTKEFPPSVIAQTEMNRFEQAFKDSGLFEFGVVNGKFSNSETHAAYLVWLRAKDYYLER